MFTAAEALMNHHKSLNSKSILENGLKNPDLGDDNRNSVRVDSLPASST